MRLSVVCALTCLGAGPESPAPHSAVLDHQGRRLGSAPAPAHTGTGTLGSRKFVVAGWASHRECAIFICPKLGGSLACVSDAETNQLLVDLNSGDGVQEDWSKGGKWIGLYQDKNAEDAEAGWDSWTSGCESPFRHWASGVLWGGDFGYQGAEPDHHEGRYERCAAMLPGGVENYNWGDDSSAWFDTPCGVALQCACEIDTETTSRYRDDSGQLVSDGWRLKGVNGLGVLIVESTIAAAVIISGGFLARTHVTPDPEILNASRTMFTIVALLAVSLLYLCVSTILLGFVTQGMMWYILPSLWHIQCTVYTVILTVLLLSGYGGVKNSNAKLLMVFQYMAALGTFMSVLYVLSIWLVLNFSREAVGLAWMSSLYTPLGIVGWANSKYLRRRILDGQDLRSATPALSGATGRKSVLGLPVEDPAALHSVTFLTGRGVNGLLVLFFISLLFGGGMPGVEGIQISGLVNALLLSASGTQIYLGYIGLRQSDAGVWGLFAALAIISACSCTVILANLITIVHQNPHVAPIMFTLIPIVILYLGAAFHAYKLCQKVRSGISMTNLAEPDSQVAAPAGVLLTTKGLTGLVLVAGSGSGVDAKTVEAQL